MISSGVTHIDSKTEKPAVAVCVLNQLFISRVSRVSNWVKYLLGCIRRLSSVYPNHAVTLLQITLDWPTPGHQIYLPSPPWMTDWKWITDCPQCCAEDTDGCHDRRSDKLKKPGDQEGHNEPATCAMRSSLHTKDYGCSWMHISYYTSVRVGFTTYIHTPSWHIRWAVLRAKATWWTRTVTTSI